MAYERLKVLRSRALHNESSKGRPDAVVTKQLGNLDFLVLSGLSKVFAGCVTYPYQVIRSRLQTYEAHILYRGVMDAIGQIWAKEGIAGFYKGLGPNLLRVLPSTWVTFLVYENTKVLMPKLAEAI
jgi:solute carrier family 25 folate transporter 32